MSSKLSTSAERACGRSGRWSALIAQLFLTARVWATVVITALPAIAIASMVTVMDAPPASAATSSNYCGGVGTWNGSQCVYESQSSGSWTKPSWVSTYDINLVGGGAGGTGARISSGGTNFWAVSGGAGSLASQTGRTDSSITFTIGSGGSGGANSTSNSGGGSGGSSTTSTGLTAAGGTADAGGGWFSCSSNPATHNGGQASKPGPLSGKAWGSSGRGGFQENPVGYGSPNLCPSQSTSNGEAGTAGGIQIIFDKAPTPTEPTLVTATADSSNSSISVAFSGASNLGGLTPTYTARCIPASGSTLTTAGSSSPITISSATRGQTYTCTVQTATLGGSSNYSSASSSVLVPGAPQNTVAPSFTGTPAYTTPAQVLTGSEGTWDSFGFAVTGTEYQWEVSANGSSGWSSATGSGATTLNYTIVSADVSKYLRLTVRKQNTYGWSDWAASTASLQVTTAPAFTADSPPVIADEGYFAGYTFAASGNRITYSITSTSPLTGLPAGMSINGSSGALTGTPNAGTAGVYTYKVVATNDSGTATTATLTLTVSSGTPASITVATQPVGGASGAVLATQPVVQLKDSGGRLVAQPQAVVVSASGGTLGGTTSVTTANGVATYTNLTMAGLVNTNYTLTFTRTAATGTSSAFQVTPGALASISVTTQPVAGAAAGSTLAAQPVVTLLDAQGNVINDRSQTVVVTSELAAGGAGGSVGGTTSLSTSTGVATFTNLTFGGLVGTSYRLKFSSGAVTVLSNSISNTLAGDPARLSIQTQPALDGTQLVGSAFTTQPVVRILDAGGNLTTSTASITAAASGGTLGGTSAVAAVSGTATYSGLTFAGVIGTNYTLTFTSTGLTSVMSASFQFANASQVGPVSLATSTITASPSTRPADGSSTSTVTVQAKDAGGNNITSSQGVVTLSTTAGTLGAVTDNTNGTYTATFTAPATRGSGSAVISGTLAGSALTQTATVSLFTTQTITFTQPADVPLGTLPYQLAASASSGLPVVFTLGAGTTNSACTVSSGGIVTIAAVGNCQIQADQAGNSNFWPATQVVRTYAVTATTPTAPYITSVTEQNGQASVAFTVPGFDGGAAITNYEYTLDSGTTWTALTPADAASPITIPSLTNGTAYSVAIRAVNIAGAGLASNTSGTFTPVATGGTTVTTATTTPSEPRNAQVTAEPSTTATIDWQEPASDGGAAITTYNVTVSPSGTCTPAIASASRNGSCTITGLTPGVTYTFTIRPVNSVGPGAAATITYTVPGGGGGGDPTSAQQVTLTFDPRGGACGTSTVTGPAGSWLALLSAQQCTHPGHMLIGWRPRNSTMTFAPRAMVELTSDNTLVALWHKDGDTTPNLTVQYVVWSKSGTQLRRGDPRALEDRRPAISIVTREPRRVTPAVVDAARAKAKEYGGVYVGIMKGNWWVSPRIVAAYRASATS